MKRMKTLTLNEIAARLKEQDNILVLMHKSPDGDAVGCAYGLCLALRKLGKNVMPLCSDEIDKKYDYITSKLPEQHFEPQYIVTVDIATANLIGEEIKQYREIVDLCIDHHGSNTGFAKEGYVDADSGACAEIIAKVIELLDVAFDKDIANAIFTGISTDTGCFKYSNATAKTYRIAADMIDRGADSAYINRIMFDTKSRSRLEVERLALETIEFFDDGKIAVICLTNKMRELSGASEDDTEGISALPRQIEGVKVGITLNEKEENVFKISTRSTGDINVSAICANFGGGGHKAAAGCVISGSITEVKEKIVGAAQAAVKEFTFKEFSGEV